MTQTDAIWYIPRMLCTQVRIPIPVVAEAVRPETKQHISVHLDSNTYKVQKDAIYQYKDAICKFSG